MSNKTQLDDGQSNSNFYVPSVMGHREVITNILTKFSKAGVTHIFQGNSLIITAGTYSNDPQEKILQDLKITIIEVLKFLKNEFKGITDKSLNIGKEENETFDIVANYTSNKMSLCRLTCTYNLPDSTAQSDKSGKKAEIRGNIPIINPRNK